VAYREVGRGTDLQTAASHLVDTCRSTGSGIHLSHGDTALVLPSIFLGGKAEIQVDFMGRGRLAVNPAYGDGNSLLVPD
jgi:hypothetical protein